jgi:membrane protease YdiL (CAAX protease family)
LFCVNLYLFFLTYRNNSINFNTVYFFEFIKLYLLICILPGICEEFFFRRIVIEQIRPAGKYLSVLISALAFSLYHIDFNKFIIMFIVGVAFSILYIKSKSLVLLVIIHSIYNSIGLMFILLIGSKSNIKITSIYEIFMTNTNGTLFKLIGLAFPILCLVFTSIFLLVRGISFRGITPKQISNKMSFCLLTSIVIICLLSVYQFIK